MEHSQGKQTLAVKGELTVYVTHTQTYTQIKQTLCDRETDWETDRVRQIDRQTD